MERSKGKNKDQLSLDGWMPRGSIQRKVERTLGRIGEDLNPRVEDLRERFEGRIGATGLREEPKKKVLEPTLGLDPGKVKDR